jgi:hypothetical protein
MQVNRRFFAIGDKQKPKKVEVTLPVIIEEGPYQPHYRY